MTWMNIGQTSMNIMEEKIQERITYGKRTVG